MSFDLRYGLKIKLLPGFAFVTELMEIAIVHMNEEQSWDERGRKQNEKVRVLSFTLERFFVLLH